MQVKDVEVRPRRTRPGNILAVRLEVYGGEFDMHTVWAYFTPATTWSRLYYRSLLKSAGVRTRRKLIDQHVRAQVVIEQFHDRLINRIRKFWP